MKKIHYIHHTHWDREWYRSAQAFNVRLVSTMDLLIATLQKDAKLKYFVLDGQVAMLEDYLKIKPQKFNDIKELVEQKRLLIGPWYIQPDMFLVSSESLLRNLQIGMNYALSNFNDVMKVGWIPDAFGQISQTPQIFGAFNFTSIYSWRGFNHEHSDYNYFMWEAPNKKRLINIHFYLGYGFFRYLNADQNKAKEELLTNVNKFVERTFSDNILFTGGSDHASVQTNLSEIIANVKPLLNQDGYDIEISTPQILVDNILNFVQENDFKIETFKGEAKSPKQGRIHAGIASTRQDIKQASKFYEELMVDVIEPLNIILQELKMPSNFELALSCWKLLLQNQFHDSIYSSSPQQVNDSVEHRYLEIKQLSYELIFEALRYTRDRTSLGEGEFPLIIFNTLAFERNNCDVIVKIPRKFKEFAIFDQDDNEVPYQKVNDYEFDFMSKDFLGILDLNSHADAKNDHCNDMYYDVVKINVKNIVSHGYEVYKYKNEQPTKLLVSELKNDASNNTFENKHMLVQINNNGTINITNKQTNQTLSNLLEIVNSGDCGDEYNYSWPQNDLIISSKNELPEIKCLESSAFNIKYVITYNLNIPRQTSLTSRSKELVNNKYEVILNLNTRSKNLDVKVKIDNNAKDQISLLKLPNLNQGTTHLAGDDFYLIERENQIHDAHLWKEQKLSEIPLPMYTFKNLLHFSQDVQSSVNVFSKSLCEYEIKDQSDLYLTLFRSVSHLGKKDLATRPGRASGYLLATPKSQLLTNLEFDLQINLGNNNKNELFNAYKDANTEVLSVAHRLTNTDAEEWFWENRYFADIESTLNSKSSFVSINKAQISLSALHQDFTNPNAFNVRLFNANVDNANDVLINLNELKIKAAHLINMDNTIQKELNIKNNQIVVEEISPYTFVTIKLIKE